MKHNKSVENRMVYLQGKDSLREFARKCAIPESTMRGYISGKRIMPIDVAKRIADTYAIPLAWLMTGKLQPIKDIHPEKLRAIYELDPEVIDLEIEDDRILPVVRAYDDEEEHLSFYCIHCREMHHHGRGGQNHPHEKGRGGMAGHRIAHCIAMNSPFRNHGVVLDVVGTYKEQETQNRDIGALICPKCRSYYSAAFNACECGFINAKRKSKYPVMAQIFQEPFLHLPFHPSQEDLDSLKELHSDNFEFLATEHDISALANNEITEQNDDNQPSLGRLKSWMKPTPILRKVPEYSDKKRGTLDQDIDVSSAQADLVPVVYIEDTYASAGSGIINYEAARRVMTFDRGFLTAQLGIHQFDNIHVIHAVGDSMEPTIYPGDLLFVNPGEKEIVTGAVYVFLIGEETMVKRIERNPITAELILRSDNNQYEPVRIDKENLSRVQVIGRVIGNFRKF